MKYFRRWKIRPRSRVDAFPWCWTVRVRIPIIPDTSSQTCGIQIVTGIQPCAGALQLTFPDGSTATLPADHPDLEVILRGVDHPLVQ
jgi:hypothetical protein